MAAPALLLASCQVVAQAAPPPARLLPDQASANVTGATAAPRTPALGTTYTIKRDTLHQSLALAGKVEPARSAQLTFHATGTVTAVNVATGQTVEARETLAELTLDDNSLQAARTQATLADLAYQSEQAKLDELKSGANADTLQQMRVAIERDQAEIQKLEDDRAGVKASNDRANQALAAARDEADHKVALAEEAVQAAKDALTAAQQNVQEVQDDAQAAQYQAVVDAQSAVTVATASVRTAERHLDQANHALAVARKNPASTGAIRHFETQQLRVDQDRDVLSDAEAAVEAASGQMPTADHTSRQIAAEVSSATAAAKTARRTLVADSLELQHMQSDLADAKAADADGITVASQAVDDAKEQLASAQQVLQLAQQKADTLAKQTTLVPTRAGQQSMANAQAAVKQGEANARTAELNLEQARAAQSAARAATIQPATFVEHLLAAAQLQLSIDQDKLKTLEAGSSAAEIERQEVRLGILRDQANAAALAAQPIVALTAPFAGTVGSVGVSPGQAIGSSPQAADTGAQTPAIQLIATGADSVVADAAESDVAQLSPGQPVDITFPGLPGQNAQGKSP